MKQMNSLKERVIAMLLAVTLIVGMLPFNTVAATGSAAYGTVEGITAGAEVTDANGAAPVVKYETADLTWTPADPSIGRMSDGWWVGIKITAPADMTTQADFIVDSATYVKYQTGVGDGWSADKNFWNAQDSDKSAEDTPRYLTMWGKLDENILKTANMNGKSVTYKWQFDWDMDGSFEQLVTLSIDPSTIELVKDEVKVYPAASAGYGEVVMLTGGANITGSGTANVAVEHNTETKIAWAPADTTIGRYQDGWWAGMKITAPAGITAEQLRNVHYMSGTNLREFWAAKDSADDATEHFITMWIPLNGLMSGPIAPYTYKFDWNNDGVFEQTVTLSVDAEKVTLTKDGVQVYPALSSVSTYTGGTVSGSETGAVTVTVEQTTLDWSPTDLSIGRYMDAWWAGIKVTAPDGMTEAQLRNVQYQRKDTATGEWSANKSFWSNKDSQSGDTEHYIGMWIPLTPEIVASAIAAGSDITRWYRFDWDNDGDFEQSITFSVDPNGATLNKKDQTGFSFATTHPADIWVGQATYQNVASGGQSDGEITYEIISGNEIASIAADGTITFTGVGTVTVRATRAGNDFYNPVSTQYTITSYKEEQTPQFTTSNPSNMTYAPGAYLENPLKDLANLKGDVSYEVTAGADVATVDTNGKLTILKAGEVTVTATVAGDSEYKGAQVSYTLTVEKAEQTNFGFTTPTPADATYNDNSNEYTNGVVNAMGEGTLTYSIVSGSDVATIDAATGKLTILKAGTVVVQAQKLGDDCYHDSAVITYTLKVLRDDQDGFGFAMPTPADITYNDNGNVFENLVVNAKGEGALTYTITSGSDVATIDAVTGKLTILKAGTVSVKATKAGNDRYKEATASYTLIINKDEQTLSFDETAINEYYGILEYTNAAPVSSTLHGTGAFTYEIVGENKIGASIDAATGKLTFADSTDKIGSITVKVTRAADDCYNECSAQYTFTLAYLAAPAQSFSLDGAKLNDSGWYTGTVNIQAPENYLISYSNNLSSEWEDSLPYNTEGANQTTTVYLKDSNGYITDAIAATGISLDKTKPENLRIVYHEIVWQTILNKIFGFTKQSVLVEFAAADAISGIAKMEWSKDGGLTYEALTADLLGKYTATVNPQYRGEITLRVTDNAGNVITTLEDNVPENDGQTLIVDDKKPERTVSYSTPYKVLDKATMLEVETYQEGDNSILYYKNQAVVTFEITEANFDLTLLNEDTKPVIKVNGTPVRVEWTQNGDVWTAEYTITGDGDYVVTMSYKDLSSNKMVDYESCKIVIDGTPPRVDVEYTDGTPTQTIEGTKYYKTTQTVTIQITDHNFLADDVVLTVTAKNVQGDPVDISAKAYADYAKDRANWTTDGDVHTLNTAGMVFDVDAIYSLDVVYDDICDNFADDYAEDRFVVDHNPPENLTITYSTPVIEKVIETLTFGLYKFYKAEVVVKITANDVTSGVDFFDWTYTKQDGSSEVNAESFGGKIESKDITYSEKDKVATATIKIPADARGYITASVTDRAGNISKKDDNKIINVVDKIAPEITVAYTADGTDTKVQFVDGNQLTVDSFDKATNAFYNGNVTANIVINEANFFEGVVAADGVIHQVGIKLTKTDDDGNVTVTEYLPAGATQKYADAKAEYITWTTDGDKHSFSISYADNADYVLEIEYTDLSTNEADITANDGQSATKAYTSKIVTVDKVAPVIKVEYGNTEVINTIENRKYFDKVQNATITVTEHNFRAADMKAVVTAVDFLKANVTVADFAAQLADEKNWIHDGNVHTAKIAYTVDANYTFDIDFLDLALNASADYITDLFTVDTTAPTNLTVSYSTNVFQEILESITFGYYNATMTVTITADDPTTGIHHFAYSYINSAGVSDVNAQLLNQAIEAAAIKHDGITGTATFDIPKLVLANDNQFNGTVEFTAYDRGENSTELKDTTRIIVDNISPTATITYNNPVQNFNDVSYYDGNIEATITINEANFDAKDVIVTVTKDGANYPVNVTWRNNSVDSHTGSFVLTEDGDYFVSVQYKDKSGNQMADYKSNELTLDATAPVIKVSNIKANSANKDAEYGFVIEFSDTNLDANSLKPVLKAVVEKAEGAYEIVEIDLGEAKTVVAGQTYTYTVTNLPDDGLYTLACEVKDMSNNGMNQIVLDDGESYEQVQFSINRKGSAFGYGTEFTEKLVKQYYVYSVDSDVVIVEVNVDPIEDYTVSLNGKELVAGTDYKTEQTSKTGEWSKRTYTISKELFTAEGEYSIIVTSTDKANTTAFSDVKNLSLSFVVDQTKPVLTITGLEAGGRYQTDAQTVTLIPTDEGGRLNSLSVVVLDSNGNPLKDDNGTDISVRFEMSGEELLKYLEENDGKITFTIPEGLNNQVKIICNDCAVNAENLTNEYNELFENVTVSQNQLVIFYANKPAFYGTIGGTVAAGCLLVFLLKRKKILKVKK